MKKLLALAKQGFMLALAAIMVFTVAACASETPSTGNDTPLANSPTEGTTQEAATLPATVDDNQSAGNAFDSSRRIGVYTREDGSGTRDAFASITGVGDDMYVEAIVLSATGEIRSAIADNPYGIGYISLGSMNDTVKAVAIDGVAAAEATVLDGSYPIQRPFLLVTNDEKDADELVQDFLNFALSVQGQEQLGSSYVSAGNTGDYTTSGLSGTLRIGGSTSVEPLMQLIRAAYIELNPAVEIEISGGGSGVGIEEATNGVVDIGMSSRSLRDTEQLNEYIVALDGVAVIVANENPLTNLELATVKEIFTGEITSWSEIVG